MRVVSLLALSAIAYAAHSEPRVDVVEEPGLWELRDNTGTPLKNDKNIAIRVPTLEQCKLESIKAFGAAQVVELGYRCHQVVRLTVKGSCTVATPEPARPVDEEGFTVLEAVPEPALCADGLSFDIRERQWVVEYPRCGEYKDVLWIACGKPVEGLVRPEPPPMASIEEPGQGVAGLDFPVDQECPVAAVAGCYYPPTVATKPCPSNIKPEDYPKYCSGSIPSGTN
jgi:hypothetical protein